MSDFGAERKCRLGSLAAASGHRGPIKITGTQRRPWGASAVVMVPIAAAPASFESTKLAGLKRRKKQRADTAPEA